MRQLIYAGALLVTISFLILIALLTTVITSLLLKISLTIDSPILSTALIGLDIFLANFMYEFSSGMATGALDRAISSTGPLGDIAKLADPVSTHWTLSTIFFIIMFTPTFIHLLTSLTFFLLHLIENHIKTGASIVLARLVENDKGVLTQISLLIGLLISGIRELSRLI